MEMKITRFRWLIAAPLAMVLAGIGCATAKKPVAVLPAFQGAPKIQQAAPAPDKPSASASPVSTPPPAKVAVKSSELKPDPVATLIARVEAEYQAGLQLYNSGQ